MEKLHIAVLFGGCSSEHDISLQSAHAVLTHLDPHKYALLPVGITRAGDWLLYSGPLDALLDDSWQSHAACCEPCLLSPSRSRRALRTFGRAPAEYPVDAIFPVLHGKNGEDGTVQGLAELAGIPVIGCGCLASALAMDKYRAHQLAAQAGVRVPRGRVFGRRAALGEVMAGAEEIGWPLFVKPVRAGSSFGVAKVAGPEGLAAAVAEARRYDEEVLLEEAVPGFEVGCAVLGNDELTLGVVDEIELGGAAFTYSEKYHPTVSRTHTPARIPASEAKRVQRAAAAVYRALGCRGFARVDLFYVPAEGGGEGSILLNEVNTIPGFTDHSRFPTMMQAAGLGFGPLLDELVRLGVAG